MINLNANRIEVRREAKGQIRYEFPADVSVLGAGGGGGSTAVNATYLGGGGAGSLVSSSILLVPNINYDFTIPAGGTAGSNGSDTTFEPYTVDFFTSQSIVAGGGKPGTLNGGNSGTGSLTIGGSTTTISGFTGGTGLDVGGEQYGGGGAGNNDNGGNAVFNTSPSDSDGGNGGEGQTPVSTFSVPENGGGGGGGVSSALSAFGPGADGGGDGGDGGNGTSATRNGSGGGGPNASGGAGAVYVTFIGKIGKGRYEYDIEVTNGTTEYNSGANRTLIKFETPGAASFRYTAPFPPPL